MIPFFIFQSDHAWVKELTNNVASIKHQNLVDLIGYCLSNGVRFVVGEFECYDSTSHLFSGYSMYFTWYKRLNVALDVARALAYLHEHQVYIYICCLLVCTYVFFFFPIRLWYYLLAMICNFFFFLGGNRWY